MRPAPSDCLLADSLDALPKDALTLLERASSTSMQLGPAWYENYCQSLGKAFGTPCFAVARHHGQAVAVLPLAVLSDGRHRRLVALANYFTSLYAPALDPLCTEADLARLLRHLMSHFAPVAGLQLAPMDPEAEGFRRLQRALRHCGLVTRPYFCFGNWYLPSQGLAWQHYLAGRPGQVRSTLRRMARRFQEAGGTLEVVQQPEQLADGLAAYHAIYAASWKQAEEHPRFVDGLIGLCAARGWLRLGIARLGGRPVAAQLWIVSGGRAEIYKLAYDEAFKGLSPGSLLTAHLFQHVMEQDHVSEVDYLTGDDAYKRDWMPLRRERWGLVAHNIRTAAGAAGAARELAGWLWHRWRRRPAGPANP